MTKPTVFSNRFGECGTRPGRRNILTNRWTWSTTEKQKVRFNSKRFSLLRLVWWWRHDVDFSWRFSNTFHLWADRKANRNHAINLLIFFSVKNVLLLRLLRNENLFECSVLLRTWSLIVRCALKRRESTKSKKYSCWSRILHQFVANGWQKIFLIIFDPLLNVDFVLIRRLHFPWSTSRSNWNLVT